MKLAMTELCQVTKSGWWTSEVCGKTAEVYVIGFLRPMCQEHFEALRKHIPKLVIVDLENGKQDTARMRHSGNP